MYVLHFWRKKMKILCQLQEKQLQTVGSYKFIQMFNSFINYKFHFFPVNTNSKKETQEKSLTKTPSHYMTLNIMQQQ